jgi:gluconokinase
VTCSALKEAYRSAAIPDWKHVRLVHLEGDFNLILDRMKQREHFMKPEMLKSQFATLEPPEQALTVDIAKSPEEITAEIRQRLGI